MDFADTSSPGRMWTLAREAGDAGWDVRAERDGLNRAEWLLRLTHHGTAAYADAGWTFLHKTHPGSAGTWRIHTVHAVLDGQEHECKLTDLTDLIAHPPVPGRPAGPDDAGGLVELLFVSDGGGDQHGEPDDPGAGGTSSAACSAAARSVRSRALARCFLAARNRASRLSDSTSRAASPGEYGR
ncbi:hypothetical protein OHQ88_34140 (plasmid) [Micromonospora zamorensis]|uniref:hypothetical protein n=1 Tax=Micromonospora zamorensis TaxID=709883 RepID=UPI002E1E77AB